MVKTHACDLTDVFYHCQLGIKKNAEIANDVDRFDDIVAEV